MTTFEIEQAANIRGIASGMNLGMILRNQIIPEFLADTKYTNWQYKTGSWTTAAGDTYHDLPSDFGELREVWCGTDENRGLLEYIGEDSEKVFIAESATDQAPPSGYYLKLNASTPPRFSRLQLSAPSDGVYTIRYRYIWTLRSTDHVTPVDMDQYIPSQFHWGLVEGLKREVYKDTVGLSDARYAEAKSEVEAWKQRIRSNYELNKHGSKYVYAK